MTTFALPSIPSDPLYFLGYHLLIHEISKPHYPQAVPLDGWMISETLLAIQAGTFHTFNVEKEFLTFPIDLIQTNEFVLVIDSDTNEILADFNLHLNVLKISYEKKALIFRDGDTIGGIKIKSQAIFNQLLCRLSHTQPKEVGFNVSY